MVQDLAQEISDLTQLLQCRLDDELRKNYEGRLTHAIIERQAQITRAAQQESAALRDACTARCSNWQHCSGCPVEAQIQAIVIAAQISIIRLGRRGTGNYPA